MLYIDANETRMVVDSYQIGVLIILLIVDVRTDIRIVLVPRIPREARMSVWIP